MLLITADSNTYAFSTIPPICNAVLAEESRHQHMLQLTIPALCMLSLAQKQYWVIVSYILMIQLKYDSTADWKGDVQIRISYMYRWILP